MNQLIAIILLIAALAIFIFWIQPLWKEVGVLKLERVAFEETLKRFSELREARDDLLSKYNSVSQDDMVRLRRMLPTTPDGGGIIVELEALGRKHGLLLKQVGIAQVGKAIGTTITTKKKGHEIVQVNFSLSGSYGSFRTFLKDIERSLRIIDITSISFVAGSVDSYEFLIQARSYFSAAGIAK